MHWKIVFVMEIFILLKMSRKNHTFPCCLLITRVITGDFCCLCLVGAPFSVPLPDFSHSRTSRPPRTPMPGLHRKARQGRRRLQLRSPSTKARKAQVRCRCGNSTATPDAARQHGLSKVVTCSADGQGKRLAHFRAKCLRPRATS